MASQNTLKYHPKAPHPRTLERPFFGGFRDKSGVMHFGKVPEGYALNGRGDLINLAKQ